MLFREHTNADASIALTSLQRAGAPKSPEQHDHIHAHLDAHLQSDLQRDLPCGRVLTLSSAGTIAVDDAFTRGHVECVRGGCSRNSSVPVAGRCWTPDCVRDAVAVCNRVRGRRQRARPIRKQKHPWHDQRMHAQATAEDVRTCGYGTTPRTTPFVRYVSLGVWRTSGPRAALARSASEGPSSCSLAGRIGLGLRGTK